MRTLLEPIGRACADIFGFQTTQPDSLSGVVEDVRSNLDNQLDHLVCLLSQRMDRQPGGGWGESGGAARCTVASSVRGGAIGGAAVESEEGGSGSFEKALGEASRQLHDQMLGNYMRWTRHLGLRSRTAVRGTKITVGSFAYANASDFGTRGGQRARRFANERAACNLRLHRLVLFLLIWGEAANLRHTPECLCFIFYCASNALVLTHPAHEVMPAHPPRSPRTTHARSSLLLPCPHACYLCGLRCLGSRTSPLLVPYHEPSHRISGP